MPISRATRLKYSLALGALAVASASIGFAKPLLPPQPSPSDLPNSILGAWEATSIAGFGAAGGPAYFNIDFVDATTLFVDIDAPRARWSNISFEYSFTGPHIIHISGRLADDWDLRLEGQNLIVTPRWWLHEGTSVAYSRARIPNWPLILLGLSLLVVTLAVTPTPIASSRFSKGSSLSSHMSTPQRLALIGSAILAFVFGFWAGPYAWEWPQVTFNRPPWNHTLILLIGLAVMVLGARLVTAAISTLRSSGPWTRLVTSSLGAALVGSSLLPLTSAAINFGIRLVYGTWGI